MLKDKFKKFAVCASALVSRDRSGKILFYHDVFNNVCHTSMGTPLSVFASHVRIARENGFSFVPSNATGEMQLQLCFDDGFRGIYDCREFLIANHLTPTISIAPALIGKPGYLTVREITLLAEYGFNFISHTWSHRTLTDLPHTELDHELLDSRKAIADIIGKDVNSLCYPRGRFSNYLINRAYDAGYWQQYSSVPGKIDSLNLLCVKFDHCQLFTRHLVQFADRREFRAILDGGMAILRSRYLSQHFIKD